MDTSRFTLALTDLGGGIKTSVTKSLKKSDPISVTTELKKTFDSFSKLINPEKVLAVGIGVSGLVLNNEKLLLSTSLKWNGFELKREIEDYVKKPVIIENITATNGLFI